MASKKTKKKPERSRSVKKSTNSATLDAPRRVEAELVPDDEVPEDHNLAAGEEPTEEDVVEIGSTHPTVKISPIALDDLDHTTRAISPTDPLRKYLEEIRRHPLLAPEDEFKLAIELRDKGDLNAAKALVAANLRLVVKIAFEYKNFYSNALDLIQEGNIGLMKAVSKFDPTKGARLGYYASWWIRSYILKYLLDNFRLVKVGTTQAQKKLFYHLVREKERLEAQGVFAGPKLLAEKLDVREKDVREMQLRLSPGGGEVSLDAPMTAGDSDSPSFLQSLASDDESAEDRMAREQMLDLLRDKMPAFQKTLDDKEAKILKDRLLAEEPKTLQEIADQYGLTRERARQIEAKVIQKLRQFMTHRT